MNGDAQGSQGILFIGGVGKDLDFLIPQTVEPLLIKDQVFLLEADPQNREIGVPRILQKIIQSEIEFISLRMILFTKTDQRTKNKELIKEGENHIIASGIGAISVRIKQRNAHNEHHHQSNGLLGCLVQ